MSDNTKVLEFTFSAELAKQLCKIAGVDPDRCERLTIYLAPQELIRIETEMVPSHAIEGIDWEGQLGVPIWDKPE